MEACIRGAMQASGALVVSINISLKDSRPLYKFKQYFEVGTIALYPQEPPYKYYTFTAYSKNAGIILSTLLPLLIVKKEEALLALEAVELSRHDFVNHLPRLAQIFNALKEAKRRAPDQIGNSNNFNVAQLATLP